MEELAWPRYNESLVSHTIEAAGMEDLIFPRDVENILETLTFYTPLPSLRFIINPETDNDFNVRVIEPLPGSEYVRISILVKPLPSAPDNSRTLHAALLLDGTNCWAVADKAVQGKGTPTGPVLVGNMVGDSPYINSPLAVVERAHASLGVTDVWAYWIATPLMEIDLHQFLLNHRITADEAAGMFHQMTSAVADLHAAKLIHNDIKLTNWLKTGPLICLADFDFVRTDKETHQASLEGAKFGTPKYVQAQLDAGERYGEALDIYCLGLCFSQILSRLKEGEKTKVAHLKEITNHILQTSGQERPSAKRIVHLLTRRCTRTPTKEDLTSPWKAKKRQHKLNSPFGQ